MNVRKPESTFGIDFRRIEPNRIDVKKSKTESQVFAAFKKPKTKIFKLSVQ